MHILIYLFLFVTCNLASAQDNTVHFPVTGDMRTRVDFWKKIYTEVTSREGLVHDSEDLSIIYKKISLSKSRRTRIRESKKIKNKIKKLLRSIAKKNYKNLKQEEQELVEKIGKRDKKELYRMSKDIRIQYGMRDRYSQGLIRSYAYLHYIDKIFEDLNLPHELTYLPHVESSFNYHAYSKVGAAGIWQFMRSTARHYRLKVGYIIDERRDPIKATKAAAKLLQDNYRKLRSWPLALTAYNHGARSMERAIKKVGSNNINTIIEKYDGRRFGFASKNFYATFMATVEISRNPEQYFPSFKKPKPYIFSSIKLDRPYTINQIMKQTGLTKQIIKEYNPAIRKIAYRTNLYLPKKFEFRTPKVDKKQQDEYLFSLKELKTTQKDLRIASTHIINRGETLYDISRIYRVAMNDIIQFNQISNPSRIYAGMKIKIPGEKDKVPTKVALNVTKLTKTKELPNLKAKHVDIGLDKNVANFVVKRKRVAKAKLPSLNKYAQKEGSLWKPQISLDSYLLGLRDLGQNIYQITIETEETLGHYAEWANVRTQSIRDLNRIRRGRSIQLGGRLKIKLSPQQKNKFIQQREEYHLSIQEDFYESYNVAGSEEYTVRRGDNLTSILQDLNLPYWLVRKEQKDKKLSSRIYVGQKIGYPKVTAKNEEASQIPEDKEEI